MLGYDSPEDLITTVINIPKQLYLNPEDRKVLLKMIEEQGPVRGFETQFYRKNGSMIWVSVNQQAVRDAGGHLLYYEGFNEDITIKKEGIERIKKALGATVQAMAVTVETGPLHGGTSAQSRRPGPFYCHGDEPSRRSDRWDPHGCHHS
jgi:PAS domain S-box-containing protein